MKTYKFNPRLLMVFGFAFVIMGILIFGGKTHVELNFGTAMVVVANVLIAVGGSFQLIEKQ